MMVRRLFSDEIEAVINFQSNKNEVTAVQEKINNTIPKDLLDEKKRLLSIERKMKKKLDKMRLVGG